MSFRLVSKSVTLNDPERRNGRFLRYFSDFGTFSAHCVKVVEDVVVEKVHVRYRIS